MTNILADPLGASGSLSLVALQVTDIILWSSDLAKRRSKCVDSCFLVPIANVVVILLQGIVGTRFASGRWGTSGCDLNREGGYASLL